MLDHRGLRVYNTTMPKKRTDLPARGKPYGLYLNREMSADVDEIAAAETGGNYHALLQFAVKYFIREYKAGRVKIKKETVTRLKLD